MDIPTKPSRRNALSGLAALTAVTLASNASAHHGWTGYGSTEFSLTGKVESVDLGNPHGLIKLRAQDGLWDVLLAPPAQTKSAGVVAGVIKVGDTITARGRRHLDAKKLEMKTERLIVGDKTYNVYPNRP